MGTASSIEPEPATCANQSPIFGHHVVDDVLQRHGLKPTDEVNVHFDPNIHEAVIREEDPSVPSHTVVAVLQKGYFLHDRLLRPALVKVAVGGPERTA